MLLQSHHHHSFLLPKPIVTPTFQPDFFTSLCFADGTFTPPPIEAGIKLSPEDFLVTEELGFDCSGEGEHICLEIQKTQRHTTDVAKQLAKYAGIAAKNVGFSGMKDHQAITSQWFSVWLPGVVDADLPDWQALDAADDSLRILQISRHSKKLKRGTHKQNNFEIRLSDVKIAESAPSSESIEDTFEALINQVVERGVPNYFGEQRFGFGGNNLNKALDWFNKGFKIKQPNKRSMLLSSARSWLFNTVLSKRIENKEWLQVKLAEPLNLYGSKALYLCEDVQADQARLEELDINTTGPMWGRARDPLAGELGEFEAGVLTAYPEFLEGLEREGLSYDRRSLRCLPNDVSWSIEEEGEKQNILLSFSLQRGEYATIVLRELVKLRDAVVVREQTVAGDQTKPSQSQIETKA